MKLSQTSFASFDLLTHVDINLSVSVLTVLIALIRGCFVTISPFSAIATEMFSLRQRYTLSMSRYILPSCVTNGCPIDLHPWTFVFSMFPSCLTTSMSLKWSIFCPKEKKNLIVIKVLWKKSNMYENRPNYAHWLVENCVSVTYWWHEQRQFACWRS